LQSNNGEKDSRNILKVCNASHSTGADTFENGCVSSEGTVKNFESIYYLNYAEATSSKIVILNKGVVGRIGSDHQEIISVDGLELPL
jgi:hypothetical protein